MLLTALEPAPLHQAWLSEWFYLLLQAVPYT